MHEAAHTGRSVNRTKHPPSPGRPTTLPILRNTALSTLSRLLLALAFAPAALASSNYTTPYTIKTISGLVGLAGVANGQGTIALFQTPSGIAVDSAGNVYVSDTGNSTIRKITPTGLVSTLAGSPGVIGGQDGTGAAAQFGAPTGIAVDGAGNLYVADSFLNTIRKVTPAGVVTTIAGTPRITGHADGTGPAAQFNQPSGIGVDGNGNVYVADTNNDTVRKVTPAGVVTTVAGLAGVSGSANGSGSTARFNLPDGLVSDANGNLFVADQNEIIRTVSAAGAVASFAGSVSDAGSSDGAGSAALFYNPTGLALDALGNLYVADSYNDIIRMVAPSGVTTTLAGRVSTQGSADGTGTTALFDGPAAVAVDGSGNLYVADTFNDTIREGSVAASDGSPPRLINISTRGQVGTGANILIPGFAVAGAGQETLLIRGVGPSLGQFNISGTLLPVPVLTVFDSSGKVIASNKGWGSAATSPPIVAAETAVGAFLLGDNTSDCALILTLTAGTYTAQISSGDGSAGIALAEVYEMASTGPRLTNISTRALVGTGNNVLIPGFVISGSGKLNLLLRADGPALSQFGLTGVLAQPELLVFDTTEDTVGSDTGWGTSLNAAEIAAAATTVGAFALPQNSADSATILSLSPGSYTMEVTGSTGGSGVALAEIYELP
jgi:sugar lactone lactonase YvrE